MFAVRCDDVVQTRITQLASGRKIVCRYAVVSASQPIPNDLNSDTTRENYVKSGNWWNRTLPSSWRNGINTSASVSPTVFSPTAVLAVDVRFSDDALHVRLSDGREVSVPLEWFPRLRDPAPEQRANRRFIARGIGIH